MANAYSCTFLLDHPTSEGLVVNFFQIAENEEDALLLSKEQVSEAEFISDTRDWTIKTYVIKEIHREDLEQAATEVLGWQPPER